MKTQLFKPQWIHALKPGTWYGQNGAATITAADIERIAQSYNPDTHEAPAVVGHPATDDPAYGWVRAAEARPDGLWLNTDLLPEMADSVARRLYSKVSVALYNPDSPTNPFPGGFSLKHLGFLGAQPPAVKGLKPIALEEAATSADLTIITFEEKKEPVMDPTVETPQATALAEKEQTLTTREAALAERERKLRRQELSALVQPHIASGRVLPAQKPFVLALMERIDGDTVTLSEGDAEKPMLDAFVEFLGKAPAQVNLSEVSAPAPLAPPAGANTNFSSPTGYEVDPESLVLHEAVQTWLKANPGKTYVEALTAVEGAQ